MVEHDADTIRAADHLIDLGPSGGRNGGNIVAEGPPAIVLASPASPTGRALARARHRLGARLPRRFQSGSSSPGRAPTTSAATRCGSPPAA